MFVLDGVVASLTNLFLICIWEDNSIFKETYEIISISNEL